MACSRRRTRLKQALYTLYLSSVGSFILYALISGAMTSINTFLLGLVVTGGLHIIFRGLPENIALPATRFWER